MPGFSLGSIRPLPRPGGILLWNPLVGFSEGILPQFLAFVPSSGTVAAGIRQSKLQRPSLTNERKTFALGQIECRQKVWIETAVAGRRG